MKTDAEGHCCIERVYGDPSAAHERALRFKLSGAYRVNIAPDRGRFVVEAWFRNYDIALNSLGSEGKK